MISNKKSNFQGKRNAAIRFLELHLYTKMNKKMERKACDGFKYRNRRCMREQRVLAFYAE
jgi:hypothetical protein